MLQKAEIWTVDGQSLGLLVLKPETSRSGKAGYQSQGKLTLGSVRYQGQAQLVAIAAKIDSGDIEGEG